MKKTKTMFRKINGVLTPQYPVHFQTMIELIKDEEIIQGEFSSPRKSKSSEQLGYLHAAIYPFILATLVDMGYDSLYREQFKDFHVDVKITSDSIDHFFKKMFEVHIQGEFRKRSASKESMRDYISFIDKWMIDNIGQPIPDAIRRD